MFAISWRNPTEAEAHWGLDTYVAATLQAIEVIRSITKSRKVGLISGCAGGYTAMAVLGYLAEIGDQRVSSHSLLVTSLVANGGSILELFATPDLIEQIRRYTRTIGVMEGAELFQGVRLAPPDDLVWRYWINNYSDGTKSAAARRAPLDNDPTRLPAALNNDFLDIYERTSFGDRTS